MINICLYILTISAVITFGYCLNFNIIEIRSLCTVGLAYNTSLSDLLFVDLTDPSSTTVVMYTYFKHTH